ncbi:transcriptional regulator of the spore photoproduct lyase operon [Natronobacillus azotifigens]|uniref:Transcriptional regulator n=1 Tax=Natronobacillus azotifigens TaxID=472978 RepID=A0A9J6REN8_9BACI|nr:transcriptional regulator SplA domain-containing protein [Natronobacillus azotifigens]MCZ0704218.1 transcriptional regulator [Natronobacillus azotifigens]
MEMNDLIYQPGDIVYVIIRNPHVQGAANVQEAAVVQNPDRPGELALFIYETYYPLTDEVAVYTSESEAEMAFEQAFGTAEDGETYYG